VKVETQRDSLTGRYRAIPTLPASQTLMAEERGAIEQHVGHMNALCDCTPANNAEAEQDTLRAVTELVLVLPSAQQNEISVEARGAAFMIALDDIAPWAVRAAIRRWHRGDCGTNHQGENYDYHWCPAPAEVRRIALIELWRVKGRAELLRRLLSAEPLVEYSDEYRAGMLARLSNHLRTALTSPVGSNGSGGAVGAS
jgi:hypothetical protein